MKSIEFITEINEKHKQVFEQMRIAYNLDAETMNKIVILAQDYNITLTLIEPLIQIGQNCKYYLNEVNYDAFKLFRGLQKYVGDFSKKQTRLTEREPQGMGLDLQQRLNEYFTEYYGSPFRNAMFCTGNENETETFGDTYIVFPINKFKYLWSTDINDINYAFSNWLHNIDRDERIKLNRDESSKNFKFMNEIITKSNYKTTDLLHGIQSNNEIMIRCKEYYVLSNTAMPKGNAVKAMIEILKLAK